MIHRVGRRAGGFQVHPSPSAVDISAEAFAAFAWPVLVSMSVRVLAIAWPAHDAACAFVRLVALDEPIVEIAVAVLPIAVCASLTAARSWTAWQPASASSAA